MKTQENLIQRKIPYQPVSDGDVGIPSSPTGAGMPIPTDVNHAIRKLKKGDWEADRKYVLQDGDNVNDQSVYVMLHPAEDADALLQLPHKTAPIIVKFNPGNRPVWSHYVANDAPIYDFTQKIVKRIEIEWSNPETIPTLATRVVIIFDDDKSIQLQKKGDKFSIIGIKVVQGQSLEDFEGENMEYKTCLEYSPAPQGAILEGCGVVEDDNFYENFEKIYTDGGAVYYFKPEADVFVSPDIYVGTDKEDEYLLPPEVDFGAQASLGADEAIVFTLVMDNPTFTTDNYTGRNSRKPSSKLVETIMFPGDEGLLAPAGMDASGNTVNCGENSPEGRVLKSITPAIDNGEIVSVLIEFRDGTRAVFPDEETREFIATDKETGQMLKGVVQKKGFYKYQGNPRQEYEKVKEDRRMRNLNRDFNIVVDDVNITRAVALYGGENGEIMEIIVPDPDDASKSIIITIPMTEA
jgi:hypothetical protein